MGFSIIHCSCCQSPKGGLRDKPDKNADPYHRNYALSGLSGAQYKYTFCGRKDLKLGDWGFSWKSQSNKNCTVLDENWVLPINPVHVLPEGLAVKMREYFKQRPIEISTSTISKVEFFMSASDAYLAYIIHYLSAS